MQCPACGTETRPGVRFCEECGVRLEATCSACGVTVPTGRRFCGACGAEQAPAAGAPRAPSAVVRERFISPQRYTPPHLAAAILRSRSALTGERKQVTVLFADVSGFTSISERLDPEDVHALINRAFELALAEIHRYEGTVNQFLGDGLMALFGAPIAHEDHARRAVLAAHALREALARYREEVRRTRGIEFGVRVGLNTGLVVVGAIGDNLRMDYTAVGDTTNTAARMQQAAEPGQVVLAESTARLVEPWVTLRPLGALTVKNRTQPVHAWALDAPKSGVSRLDARAAHGLSPFVGRDDALAVLDRAWTMARAGRGQAVFVVGDAGIGKSRLLLEFRRRVASAVTWVQADCISFDHSTPFLPVVDMLKANFGVDDHDAEADVVAKIERGVERVGLPRAEVAPYLRFLLSADPGDRAVAAMDPGERRARIVGAVLRLTAAGSRRRPVVLAVEDSHWIDPASEDLLRSVADALPGMAVLLVLSYRPVYEQPFGDRTYYWRIPLQPVDDSDAIRIVRATLGADDVPGELAARVARKAEGNPFFLEELGRTLVETGGVRVEAGRVVATASAATLAVPDTVQDVIAARIDRLEEPQKRTVQTASVIGREFALGLLRRVSDVQERLEQSLADLKRIELIYETTAETEPRFVFRHALTQDVAYATLLQAERRRLHAIIGAAIETQHADRLDEHLEELVHHFRRGECWGQVVRYARDAAERAAALCVDDKAVEFYDAALDALARLPETAETARTGVDLRLAMRAPLWRGGHPDRLAALFTDAEAIATRHGLTDALDTVYAFFVQFHWAKGDQAQALEYGARCLERAEARGDLGLRITGLYYVSHAYHALGRYPEGVEHARRIMDLLDGPRARERFGLSGLPYSGACALAALCLAELGDAGGARDLIARGRAVADAAAHLYSQMVLAAAEGDVLELGGAHADAIAVLEPAVRTCRERGFLGQRINALKQVAHAYVGVDRHRDAIAAAQESIDLQERAKVCVTRGVQHTAIARAWLGLGDLDRAQGAVDTALDWCRRIEERGVGARALLVAAEIALRRGDRAGAEARLDEAQESAEELGMMPLVERCRALVREMRRAS